MLVATRKRKSFEPAVEIKSTKKSGKNSGLAKRRMCIIGAIISFFAFGVYYTSLSAVIASKGYEIEKLDQEILQLQTANERTELTVASMSSLDKVEQVATEKLGMNKPASKEVPIVVSSLEEGSSPSAGTETRQKDEEDGGLSAKLYTAFESFFEIGKAQASPGTR